MSKRIKFLSICISILVVIACHPTPELQGVDLADWKKDVNGCQNLRINMVDTIIGQRDLLRGLSQNEVISLLGTADKHQLYERSQKFFIYHLEPSIKCGVKETNYTKAFYIRFNALDQAVDFIIQEVK